VSSETASDDRANGSGKAGLVRRAVWDEEETIDATP